MRYAITAAIALALLMVSSATAMHGQFNSPGKITAGGNAVNVSGPLSLDADETGAVMHVTITQDGCTSSGDSALASGSRWEARVTGCKVHAGPAYAYAVATVDLVGGGTETYPWDQSITLR